MKCASWTRLIIISIITYKQTHTNGVTRQIPCGVRSTLVSLSASSARAYTATWEFTYRKCARWHLTTSMMSKSAYVVSLSLSLSLSRDLYPLFRASTGANVDCCGRADRHLRALGTRNRTKSTSTRCHQPLIDRHCVSAMPRRFGMWSYNPRTPCPPSRSLPLTPMCLLSLYAEHEGTSSFETSTRTRSSHNLSAADTRAPSPSPYRVHTLYNTPTPATASRAPCATAVYIYLSHYSRPIDPTARCTVLY